MAILREQQFSSFHPGNTPQADGATQCNNHGKQMPKVCNSKSGSIKKSRAFELLSSMVNWYLFTLGPKSTESPLIFLNSDNFLVGLVCFMW